MDRESLRCGSVTITLIVRAHCLNSTNTVLGLYSSLHAGLHLGEPFQAIFVSALRGQRRSGDIVNRWSLSTILQQTLPLPRQANVFLNGRCIIHLLWPLYWCYKPRDPFRKCSRSADTPCMKFTQMSFLIATSVICKPPPPTLQPHNTVGLFERASLLLAASAIFRLHDDNGDRTQRFSSSDRQRSVRVIDKRYKHIYCLRCVPRFYLLLPSELWEIK